MAYNFGLHSPKVSAPCGFEMELPLAVYASLMSVGGKVLVVEACPKCQQKHRLVLAELTEIHVTITGKAALEVLRAPLPGNGRHN